MSQNGIRYTDEFKKQLVIMSKAGSSVSYLSPEYGVSIVIIYKWIKDLSRVKVLALNKVRDKEPTKTQYYNMFIIIRQYLDYATAVKWNTSISYQ